MNCANHPERERTAFCQNCGKPLCQECARPVGTSVFCEPCLAQRLTGQQPGQPAPGSAPDAGYGAAPYAPYTPGPVASGAPNPVLAAVLGVIPGVGAMYNGQFAKGIVHLIVFAVLVSLTDNNGIFGIFVAGWVLYQVFEAYHTAQARRDGTPLPNPFGLNDLGEKLGFGKSWASSTGTAAGSVTPAPTPADTAAQNAYSQTPYTQPYTPPAASYPPAAPFAAQQQQQQAPWDWNTYAPPAANPYMQNPPAFDPAAAPYRNRFPAGAIWLIGLGIFFLIGSSHIFHSLPFHLFLPLLLIGFGGWLFYQKMTATGPSLTDDGTPFYRVRLLSALRGSIWIVLVGFMFLLSNLHILSWGHSWPLFIIAAGVLILLERTAFSSASAYPAPPSYPSQGYAQAPPSANASETSFVPPHAQEQAPPEETGNQSNQEGR